MTKHRAIDESMRAIDRGKVLYEQSPKIVIRGNEAVEESRRLMEEIVTRQDGREEKDAG